LDKIKAYQKDCWLRYKKAIGLPENYSYLYGNPVKVHVPVDTSTQGLMVVGAYPTAHFHTIDGVADVAVADHLYPFSSDKYFDGSRVRTVNSGVELEKYYLKPIGIQRDQCWITDLVKVFLFKKGHVARYCKIGWNDLQANRHHFNEFAEKSLGFLRDEIELARPKAILLLGLEVISTVLKCTETRARELISPQEIEQDVPVPGVFFALPHPGIVMRNSEGGFVWRKKLQEELIPAVRDYWKKRR